MTLRVYVAFDDTDTIDADRGTGKVGRWFVDELPDGCTAWAVVRQQLLVHPDVPYTSHNSAAVVVIDVADGPATGDLLAGACGAPGTGTPRISVIDELVLRATRHLERHWMDGSDPGLCVAWDGCPALPALVAFGHRTAVSVVTQAEAKAAAAGAHLSGHGGTCDGIIGAAAGVGLTAAGWSGRLIDYRLPLRDFPDPISVADIQQAGMHVVSLDRHAPVPLPDDLVTTHDWLRPRLWGGRAVVPVQRRGDDDGWEIVAAAKPEQPDPAVDAEEG